MYFFDPDKEVLIIINFAIFVRCSKEKCLKKYENESGNI